MAILNWRDHPRLRFVDFPPPFLTKGSVYIASDKGDTAWISDGTAYLQLYPTATTAQDLGVMTWALKPDPTSVPVGTRFTASDLNLTDWQTNGAYWAPVNGEAVLVRKRLHDMPATAYNVLSAVPNAFNDFIIPDDLLQSPGSPVFYGRAEGRRVGTLSGVQVAQIRLGFFSNNTALGASSIQSAVPTTALFRIYGIMSQINAGGDYEIKSGGTSPALQEPSLAGIETIAFAAISNVPVQMLASNGASDGSEQWIFHFLELSVRL